MIDFSVVRDQKQTFNQLVENLTQADLRSATNEMIDNIQQLIASATDADVVFVPVDPDANDTFSTTGDNVNDAWTLGHVIVHATASSEEGAFLSAELARGVEAHGRSRYEVPWESVTTIAQCRQRLEESRRIRLAALDIWPDEPHLDNTVDLGFLPEPVSPAGRFALGLFHEDSHLAQIAEIVRQAQAAR